MDINTQLRFLFWSFVLVLWGMFAYDFLSSGKIHIPFATEAAELIKYAIHPPDETISAKPPAKPKDIPRIPIREHVDAAVIEPKTETLFAPSKPKIIIPAHTETSRKATAKTASVYPASSWPSPPENFNIGGIKGFLVYREKEQFTDFLAKRLETIRSKMSGELGAFAPWIKEKNVLIYMFLAETTYFQITGRPAWSQGTSVPAKRLMYVLQNPYIAAILFHELTHIYFDSFFNLARPAPLWLSEGMAVYMQSARGASPPQWLPGALDKIREGNYYPLEKFFNTTDISKLSDKDAQIWYAQAYSIVKFLIEMQSPDSFYQFCKGLKESAPVHQSLYRAYGLPFNKVKSLEYVWLDNLKRQI